MIIKQPEWLTASPVRELIKMGSIRCIRVPLPVQPWRVVEQLTIDRVLSDDCMFGHTLILKHSSFDAYGRLLWHVFVNVVPVDAEDLNDPSHLKSIMSFTCPYGDVGDLFNLDGELYRITEVAADKLNRSLGHPKELPKLFWDLTFSGPDLKFDQNPLTLLIAFTKIDDQKLCNVDDILNEPPDETECTTATIIA